MTVIPKPFYSPDMTPADFFVFPKIKRHTKEERFDGVEAIKKKIVRGDEKHSGRRHPEGLPGAETELGKVYCQLRRLL